MLFWQHWFSQNLYLNLIGVSFVWDLHVTLQASGPMFYFNNSLTEEYSKRLKADISDLI